MTSASQWQGAFLTFLYWLFIKSIEQCSLLTISFRFKAEEYRAILYSVLEWSLALYPDPVACPSSALESKIVARLFLCSYAFVREQLGVPGRSGCLIESQLMTCCLSARTFCCLISFSSVKQALKLERRDATRGFVQLGPVVYEKCWLRKAGIMSASRVGNRSLA